MAKKLIMRGLSKTVATAGTRVQVSTSSLWAKGLRVKAPAANAGAVYLGDSLVSSSVGFNLAPGDSLDFANVLGPLDSSFNLKDMYVDAATNGDKLTFLYYEEQL